MLMKKILLCIVLLVVAWVSPMAMPALPGFTTVTQSDGSTLTIQAVGDEWFSAMLTTDNLTVDVAEDGDYYYVTTSGISKVKAHDVAFRNAEELSFVNANREKMTVSALKKEADLKLGKLRSSQQRPPHDPINESTYLDPSGSPRIPVLLVNFKDMAMRYSKDVIDDHITNENQNSVFKYFKDQSNDLFQPQFDVYGIYTVPQNREYYGKPTSDMSDAHRGQLVVDAVKEADKKNDIDWSLYDNNGDGYIDACIVIYAGIGQAQGGKTNTPNAVWPAHWTLSKASVWGDTSGPYPVYGSDGKSYTINDFAVFNELTGKTDPSATADRDLDGIGTFCHEFSHCLGLPDFYETGGGYATSGLGEWSLMGSGCYNTSSVYADTPIGYSAFEKYFMGWLDIDTVEANTQYVLPIFNDLNKHNDQAVLIEGKYSSKNAFECWVFEYRSPQGWDRCMGKSSGVMVTHYTYLKSTWNDNQVNKNTLGSNNSTIPLAEHIGYYTKTSGQTISSLTANLNSNGSISRSTFDPLVTQIKNMSGANGSLWYDSKSGTQQLAKPVLNEISNIGGSSFDVSWNHNPSANCTYTLRVTRKGVKVFEKKGITTKNFTVSSGLEEGVPYVVKVKAVASNSDQASSSLWSDDKNVTTVAGPSITASTQSVEFKGFVGNTYNDTVVVIAENLTQPITTSVTPNSNVYQARIVNSNNNRKELIITWTPNNTDETSATVTVASGNAAANISVTGKAMPATPTLFADNDALSFSTLPNKAVSKTINITGGFISNDIELSVSNNKFQIDRSTIAASLIKEDVPVPVTVTFNTQDEGTFNGVLTMRSAGNTLLTIDLEGISRNIGFASDPYLNIANYSTINTVGANVSGMNSIYNFTQDADNAWLTVSNYGIAQADEAQKWTASTNIATIKGSWEANDIFAGSNGYFSEGADAMAVNFSQSDVIQDFFVTNCKQVKQLAYNNGTYSFFKLKMYLYECTSNEDGTINVGDMPVDSVKSSIEGIETISLNLDPEKIYKIHIVNPYSRLYEIGFLTSPVGGTQPQVDVPAITVTPASLAFDTFVGENVTENFVVTGENISKDINITSNNENFTVSPATIPAGELGDGVTVTVTFKPTAPNSNINGVITVSSQGAQSQNVNVTGVAKVHTPVIFATAEPLTFETHIGEAVDNTFFVKGDYIVGDVNIVSNNDNFTVEPATIPADNFAEGESVAVTVTFNPTVAGNINGEITISSTGAESRTVLLNGVAFAYPPELTVEAEPMAFMAEVNGEESKTFTVSGQHIGGNVTISSDNANFSVNPATIPASEFNSGEGVTVTVKFNPLSAGTHNGTITVATPGTESQNFEVSGIAYDIVAPQIVSDPRAGSDTYSAKWTYCPGATSYTLHVQRKKVTPQPDPDPDPEPEGPTLLVSDNFSKFTTDGDTDISTMLDNYMQTEGWTGSRLYEKEGGLQLGSNSYVGKLITPNLDLTNSGGKVSIKMTAYNPASAQQTQYQETSLYVKIGESSNVLTTLHVTRESQEITAVIDCDEIADQKISFETNGRKYRAILTNIEIYSGDITATADAPALITKPTFPTYRDDQTITGIQDTTYTVRRLSPLATYVCEVKAVYGDKESEWSQPIEIVTSLRPFTFDDLVFTGGTGKPLVLIDNLLVVHGDGKSGRLWCKSMGDKPANATEKKEGQIDFMREITKEQTTEWDQSYWIMLQYPEDDGENGISDLIESAIGKVINGGSVAGYYTDDKNYTLEVLPVDDVYSLSLGEEVNYTKNTYCVANFMTSNLNIDNGDGATGLDNVSYFFMNPKIQEVCEITSAKYNGDDMFVVPNNSNHIGGSLNVDWSYNADGQQWPEKGGIYHFTAVVNRMPGNDDSDDNLNYIVYPLDFDTTSSLLSAISTVYSNCEVVGVEYVNVSGLVSDKPHKGVNIVVTRYRDGSTTVTKSLFK